MYITRVVGNLNNVSRNSHVVGHGDVDLMNVLRISRVVGHYDVDLMNVSKSPRVVGGVCVVSIFGECIGISASA